MEKLGEGTYGVVYQARGSFLIIQTNKLEKFSHSKKSDSKASKKEYLLPPSDKFPSSNN